MTKIVYNSCYGGYSLSDEAAQLYCKLKGIPEPEGDDKYKYYNFGYSIERDDPVLVQVVEQLGNRANGRCAKLRIEYLPEGTLYRIQEYDGMEWIETQEDIEWKIA